MTSLTDCLVCPAGTSCAVGSAAAKPCLPGSFSATAETETCSLCAAGEFQDKHGQLGCTACTKGAYCERGTAKPTPCPGGTSSNALGATSQAACSPVLAGFWAPLGSPLPEPCPTTGFYCPGAAADELYGGSKPIIVPVGGSTTTEQVETVQKEMTLDVSCDSFDINAVKQALAAQYNVDVALISLDNPCATRRSLLRSTSRALVALTLTITIATTGTQADGTPISAPPVAELLSSVAAIDDSALASSLGTALGTAVTVSSAPPQQAMVQRVVPSTCPRGFWCTAGLTVACEVGFYNPTTNANNQSACVKCPDHAVTLGTNATSLAQCLCDADYYNDDSTGGVVCLRCPIGTSCGELGTTKTALPLKAGFFRMSNLTVDVRACSDAAVGCQVGRF